jgi:hypothetical protein
MARRYSRDNRGRFASGGTGATARGGRLKTASGKTRETKKRIIPSKESRKTGPKAFAASAESGRVNMPVKFGGEGQGYKTPRGKAAAAKSRAADAANKAAIRRSGLPTSGGAMRVKGGLKRNPGAAAKLANRTVTPKPARAAANPKTGQEIMKAEVRKVQNKKLRDINAKIKAAGPNATNLRVEKLALQSRMTATQPRQTAKQAAKSEKQTQVVRGRIAEMRRQNARIGRAQANVTRNADVRNSAASMSKASFARKPSKKTLKSQLRADRALAFYASPAKALRDVNKRKPGFRLPRNMR